MIQNSVPTHAVSIYIGGDLTEARRICREFCQRGLCVTVEPLSFIYTNGEEVGVRVGLINYPRFPSTLDALDATARELAEALIVGLHQWTASIVGPHETVWLSRRPEGAAP